MTRTTATMILVFACLIAPLAGRQQAPQPTPRFRTGVDLVVLDVSVLDSDRRPVRGLTPDEFTVLEDGRPQSIKTFTAIDLPDVVEDVPVAWMREVLPDVSRNDTLSNRRIVTLVLDDATPMPAEEVPRMKAMARRVIERLGPDDLAAVVFAFNKRAGQEFTTDRARLLAAVNKFNGGIDRQPVDGPFNPDPLQQTVVSVPFDQFNPKALQLYSSVVGTLRVVAEYLADLPERRKALVFASVGLPLDVEQAQPRLASLENVSGDGSGIAQALFKDLQKTFDAAQRANVNIYGLDPGGLRAPAGRYDALAGTGELAGSPGKLNRDFLYALSANTGGFTLAEGNQVDAGITQIFRENGSYYLLGYQPPNLRAEGKFRRVEVRVNRPGVTVRARNGYYEPRAEKPGKAAPRPPAMEKALASLVPTPDIAMQVTTAPFAVAGRREVAVAIALALRRPAPQGTERVVDDLTVVANAYDGAGKRRASDRLTGRVVLRPGSGGVAVFELLSRLDLEPGRYQLRLAVESSLQHKSGSVYCDVDVPDFRRSPLSLSGVVVSATPGIVAARKDVVASLIPVVPTAVREFNADQQVTVFLRVYEGGTNAPAPVAVTARIVDGNGATVFETAETLGPDRFSSARAADYRLDLPIPRLAPGPHLLTIEATIDGKTSARRDVRFAVW
jgi:VWFA-related protein